MLHARGWNCFRMWIFFDMRINMLMSSKQLWNNSETIPKHFGIVSVFCFRCKSHITGCTVLQCSWPLEVVPFPSNKGKVSGWMAGVKQSRLQPNYLTSVNSDIKPYLKSTASCFAVNFKISSDMLYVQLTENIDTLVHNSSPYI